MLTVKSSFFQFDPTQPSQSEGVGSRPEPALAQRAEQEGHSADDALAIPNDVLDLLVAKVVAKFTAAEISQDEAASRLVGTGRFDTNEEAVTYLKGEVFPRLEDKLRLLEEEIAVRQAEADRLRALLLGTPMPGLLGGAVGTQPSAVEKGKKKSQPSERKRRGAGGWNDSAEDGQASHLADDAQRGSDGQSQFHLGGAALRGEGGAEREINADVP